MLIKDSFTGIPSNAVVSSATLSITTTLDRSSNVRTYRVYRFKVAWVESEVTWNKRNSSTNWTSAGGFHADDCEQTDIGSVSVGAAVANGTEISISLTPSAVQEMINGSFTNNGWLIKADIESNDAYMLASSSHATESYRPKLVVEYTVPQPITHT